MQYVYFATAAIISICLIKIPVSVTAHISLDRQKILSVIRVLGLSLSVKINDEYTVVLGKTIQKKSEGKISSEGKAIKKSAKKFPFFKFLSALEFKNFSFAGYYGLDDAMSSAMSFAVLRGVINGVGGMAEKKKVNFAPVWQDGLLSSIFLKAELSALSLAVAFIGRKNG